MNPYLSIPTTSNFRQERSDLVVPDPEIELPEERKRSAQEAVDRINRCTHPLGTSISEVLDNWLSEETPKKMIKQKEKASDSATPEEVSEETLELIKKAQEKADEINRKCIRAVVDTTLSQEILRKIDQDAKAIEHHERRKKIKKLRCQIL